MRRVLKKILACFFSLLLYFANFAAPVSFVSHRELAHNLSVTFIGTGERDSVLLLICVSAGMADEILYPKVAILLSNVISKKIKLMVEKNRMLYGSENNAYVDYDQTVYYSYGKPENLEGFIRNFAAVISNFSCTADELDKAKKQVELLSESNTKIDKVLLHHNALRSLYWHSGYGNDIICDHYLELITPELLLDFFHKHYKNPKIHFVIIGQADREKSCKLIEEVFSNTDDTVSYERLEEPSHHGSVAQIMCESDQTSVIIMDMYWKIPQYSSNKNAALANELFIEYLDEILNRQLVEEQKIASSISFRHSSWNKEYGDLCITVTARSDVDFELLKLSAATAIKCKAAEGMNKQQAENALKKIIIRSNYYEREAVDAANWISRRLSAGYKWDFIRDYVKFAKSYDIEEVNEQVKKVFCNDPDVITIMVPKEEKNAI